MIVYFNSEDVFNGLFDLLDSWVAKFNYFTGVGHDDVIVLFIKV